MMKIMKVAEAVAVAAALIAGAAAAAVGLTRDLTSTIALLGLPCGQVVSAQRVGENDYLAACENKNRYRVYVNAKGRVVAEKQ
jgi:hypothetical protein